MNKSETWKKFPIVVDVLQKLPQQWTKYMHEIHSFFSRKFGSITRKGENERKRRREKRRWERKNYCKKSGYLSDILPDYSSAIYLRKEGPGGNLTLRRVDPFPARKSSTRFARPVIRFIFNSRLIALSGLYDLIYRHHR